MKRWTVVICLLASLGWAATSHAQLEPQSTMLITTAAYTYAEPQNFDQSLKGAGFSIAWEQVTWDRQMSIGFGGGYGVSWFDRSNDRFSFRRMPFYALFKGLFGPPKYTGYVGVGLGASLDRLEFNADDGTQRSEESAPFSLMVPVGMYLVPNPKVGFNFNVSWSYSNTDFLKNGSFWAFGFGVLFLM
jgi:hypothetical protein